MKQSHGWCGNSYFSVPLPANSFWDFTAPTYDGSLEVRMRYKFVIRREYEDGAHTETVVYSQQFDGRINPGQAGGALSFASRSHRGNRIQPSARTSRVVDMLGREVISERPAGLLIRIDEKPNAASVLFPMIHPSRPR